MATNTVVLGAGIIGLSTVYYLAQHQPHGTIHLVEPSPTLFASASGQAGGFLARDWFVPASESLGALSFDEHARLAAAHDGAARWGYRRSTAVSYAPRRRGTPEEAGAARQRGEDWLLAGSSRATAASAGARSEGGSIRMGPAVPPWLRSSEGDSVSVIGDGTTTAQLDPLRLCRFLLDECVAQGVRLHHPARAVAVMTDMRDELSSVRITDSSGAESDVPCAQLIVAAGAWSARVLAELFPGLRGPGEVPISSLSGHHLVVRSPRWETGMEEDVGFHAVFATGEEEEEDVAGHKFPPEMFSRAGGEIWVGGLNSAATPLPAGPAEAQTETGAIAAVRKEAGKLLGGSEGDDLEVIREGLCFRPVTPRGTPIIGRIEDERLGGGVKTRPGAEGGVFLAAGHGPWGISLSLGTGMVLAEMAQGRRLSADVSSLAMW